jgi:TonB family protein
MNTVSLTNCARVLILCGCFAGSFVSTESRAAEGTTETVLERAFALDEAKGKARDAVAAAKLYQAAAESGDAFAHLRLGYLTETGDGVPQDYAAARAHYQIATDAGLKEARLRLAICHLEGWGGPVDRPAFVREMRAAAEAGDITAQRILSAIYQIGFAVAADSQESIKWMERAAAQNDALAQLGLGRLSEQDQRKRALMPDLQLARSWYQLSAEKDYLEGMRAMARTFLTGKKSDRNWATGKRWLELAAEGGDAEALYTLAVCELLHVDSLQPDADRARDWLRQASERGNFHATEVLELEIGGRSLIEAMRYVLEMPFEDRYVQTAAAKAGDEPTRAPVIYRVVKPIYPESLRFSRTEGEVLVDFIVDGTGRVVGAKAIRAPHPLLGTRAVEAVQQWRFYPGRKDSRLVNTHMQVPVVFELKDEQLAGVDQILYAAHDMAQKAGPAALADSTDLRIAQPASPLSLPKKLSTGGSIPEDAAVLLLLVLDAAGRPLRGHVLFAEPATLGRDLLQRALEHKFQPRMVAGEATPSNAILPFAKGRYRSGVLKQR